MVKKPPLKDICWLAVEGLAGRSTEMVSVMRMLPLSLVLTYSLYFPEVRVAEKVVDAEAPVPVVVQPPLAMVMTWVESKVDTSLMPVMVAATELVAPKVIELDPALTVVAEVMLALGVDESHKVYGLLPLLTGPVNMRE